MNWNYYIFIAALFFFLTNCSKKEDSFLSRNISNEIFIAHAGGKIDGFTYTNSLEALNLSYEKGCKLFELDLLETSDGKIVAAHDWKQFKKISNYEKEKLNNDPLTEKEFLNSKIHGKYTPLNMEMINKWFEDHPDAILITDKINNPEKIANETFGFKFLDRCLMELFTWEAIENANQNKITPIVNSKLIFYKNPKINFIKTIYYDLKLKYFLNKFNIKYIALSYKEIEKNKKKLRKYKQENINTFIFHINSNPKIDETYAIKNYSKYITAIYADNLDLIKQRNN